MEIGSEFWINKEDIKSINEKEISSLNPFSKFKNIQYTTTGRGAISYLIEKLNLAGKKVLLPLYICESAILPFEENNCDIYYYDINIDLSPRIERNIKNYEVDVFFHIGYFGFETNQKVYDLIKIIPDSTIVIEDVTHNFFSKQTLKSDYYIGSIRKWLGVPSGGFVASENELNKTINSGQKEFINIRTEALIEKNEYIDKKNSNKEYLNKFNAAESLIDEDVSAHEIDFLSMNIIQTYDYEQLLDIRKHNYLYLLNNIKENEYIKIIFDQLEEEVCPMFFPIYVKNRDVFRKYLTENNIYCPVHWPVPTQVKNQLSENARWIYEHILSIPCDQRYDEKDMERIVETVNNWNINRSC